MCSAPFTATMQDSIVSFENTRSNITINDLEPGTFMDRIHMFAQSMPPLTHVCTYIDNTAAQM